MREVLCVCALIHPRLLATRVTVLMHWREVKRTTNTAKLATLALPNSEIRVRGDRRFPLKVSDLVKNDHYRSVILFPTLDAVELTKEFANQMDGPFHLIVPDGNWQQARKVATREHELDAIPRVKLPPDSLSAYQLRHSPHPERISTYEAIARAIGILHGLELRREMEALFDVMIERTLWSRGKIPLAGCRHTIPEAAIRAFYEDGVRGGRRDGRS